MLNILIHNILIGINAKICIINVLIVENVLYGIVSALYMDMAQILSLYF